MSFLSDGKGNKSSIRLVMAWWAFIVLAVWAIISLAKMTILDIPAGLLTLLTIVFSAKVAQATFAEKKNNDPPA